MYKMQIAQGKQILLELPNVRIKHAKYRNSTGSTYYTFTKRHIQVHINHEITINKRHRLNFYKTSNTTSLMLYRRLTDSETMSPDHVQLTVNIFSFAFNGFQ